MCVCVCVCVRVCDDEVDSEYADYLLGLFHLFFHHHHHHSEKRERERERERERDNNYFSVLVNSENK